MASWDSIPEAEKPFQRRLMEVFAGFTEHADANAGKVIDEIARQGRLDNTLIFYIWGDNGSSSEGLNGTISEQLAQNGIPTTIAQHLKALEELGGLDALGGPKTDNMYHAGWAWAGSTPYQGTKLQGAYFGGTRQPMAVAWPKRIKADATPRPQFHHVIDIVPTIYELTKITAPRVVNGFEQDPIAGVSMVYTLGDAKAPGTRKTQFFDIMASRGIYHDGWFASAPGPREPWVGGIPKGIKQWSPLTDKWELYHLDKDWSQANDLAAANPQKLEEMKALFLVESTQNKNLPIGGGLWSTALFHPEDAPASPLTEWTFDFPITRMPESAAPKLGKNSSLVTMEVDVPANANGVLYALAGFSGGITTYVKDGFLNYEFNLFEVQRTKIRSKARLPVGKAKIEVESKLVDKIGGPMDVTLRVNGEVVGQGRVPAAMSLHFTSNATFDIGTDLDSPVSLDYYDQAPFAFNGTHRHDEDRVPEEVARPQPPKLMTATLLLLLKAAVGVIIFAIGLDSTAKDATHLLHRPGLLLRSVLAMYVGVPLAAFMLVKLLTLAPGVELGLLVLAASAGAPLLPRKLLRIGDGAYIFSLVLLSSLLAIVVVPAWLSLLGPQFGTPLELAPTQVAWVLAKSFLLPLAVGMLLRRLAPAFAARWASRLIGAAGTVLTACALRCWCCTGRCCWSPAGAACWR